MQADASTIEVDRDLGRFRQQSTFGIERRGGAALHFLDHEAASSMYQAMCDLAHVVAQAPIKQPVRSRLDGVLCGRESTSS